MRGQKGYVLVVSVMIIGFMLIGLAVATVRTLISDRTATILNDREDEAQSLAEGCADAALLKIAVAANYAGNETMTVGSSTCTIRPLLTSPTRIQTEAYSNGQPYRLQVDLSSTNPVTITKWRRIP